MRKPYKIGDWLWVKETTRGSLERYGRIQYIADSVHVVSEKLDLLFPFLSLKPTPSLFMKKIHSRILLEVTAVKECRLQEITEEEAINEGVAEIYINGHKLYKNYSKQYKYYRPITEAYWLAIQSFETLWGSIYGFKTGCSWNDNPEVFMYQFKDLSLEHKTTQDMILHNYYNCHPILFKAEMVRAILDRTKKQTTRIKK
jgi:hypothetical protein